MTENDNPPKENVIPKGLTLFVGVCPALLPDEEEEDYYGLFDLMSDEIAPTNNVEWFAVDTAVDILTKSTETRDAFVFGYGTERGFSGWSKAKKALDKRIAEAGHKLEPWVLHDLRRSFASGLQRLKIEPHIVEACLNHTPPKLERNYQTYMYEPEKRAALARWAAHVDAVVNGKTIDNVVSLREVGA